MTDKPRIDQIELKEKRTGKILKLNIIEGCEKDGVKGLVLEPINGEKWDDLNDSSEPRFFPLSMITSLFKPVLSEADSALAEKIKEKLKEQNYDLDYRALYKEGDIITTHGHQGSKRYKIISVNSDYGGASGLPPLYDMIALDDGNEPAVGAAQDVDRGLQDDIDRGLHETLH